MAQENDTTIAQGARKKQWQARAKKAVPETAPVDVAAEPAAALSATTAKRDTQTRGRKPMPNGEASISKRGSARRAPKAVQAVAAASNSGIDEMADLLQLEKENQGLRKLLAEKLRAENTDLRKRLNIG